MYQLPFGSKQRLLTPPETQPGRPKNQHPDCVEYDSQARQLHAATAGPLTEPRSCPLIVTCMDVGVLQVNPYIVAMTCCATCPAGHGSLNVQHESAPGPKIFCC